MSLYFEGMLFCDLKPDIPQQVIDTLHYMTRIEDSTFDSSPSHNFFNNPDWRDFLQVQSDYGFVAGYVGSQFRYAYRYTLHSEDVFRYTLSFRRPLHDDVEFFEQWWDFISWLALYSETEGYVGYYREKHEAYATLIYFKDGRVFTLETTQNPTGFNGEVW
ncbi:MAG: hypothetical protein IT324_14650 [Anaerolineae bacterium]|nr:hypothetical protein [Anaerolineae bacterium]